MMGSFSTSQRREKESRATEERRAASEFSHLEKTNLRGLDTGQGECKAMSSLLAGLPFKFLFVHS